MTTDQVLKPGSRGLQVETLQLKLKAAGYDVGDVDGDYGPRTRDAVLAFQEDRPEIDDDGIAGPHTLGALDAAIARRKAHGDANPPASIVPCGTRTWDAFMRVVDLVTQKPVRYGPGRGLWSARDEEFVITYGAGRLGGTTRQWPNALNALYPSFHCSSWTNFFLSWLLRRNQDFTHAGNIPSLFDLLESAPDLHRDKATSVMVRGFGDVCYRIQPSGAGAHRLSVPNVADYRELYERRDELPTFMVCGQSTETSKGWRWWHHTLVLAVRDDRLYRIAADGSKGVKGYSATPMSWIEITEPSLKSYANVALRPYGVATIDGSYGDPRRPIASVTFEM